MFEIVFISIINSKMFNTEIYLHHKIAIGFITIFYAPLMILYNILLIKNEKKDETKIIYKIYLDYSNRYYYFFIKYIFI